MIVPSLPLHCDSFLYLAELRLCHFPIPCKTATTLCRNKKLQLACHSHQSLKSEQIMLLQFCRTSSLHLRALTTRSGLMTLLTSRCTGPLSPLAISSLQVPLAQLQSIHSSRVWCQKVSVFVLARGIPR